MKISQKIRLSLWSLLTFLALNIAAAIFFVQQMTVDTKRLAEIEEPLRRRSSRWRSTRSRPPGR